MKIKVNWAPEPLELVPCDFDHERYNSSSSDTKLRFKYNDEVYVYQWASGGGMGLSNLSKVVEGKLITVYDAWKRDWLPEHVTLHEVARELANILKHPKP